MGGAAAWLGATGKGPGFQLGASPSPARSRWGKQEPGARAILAEGCGLVLGSSGPRGRKGCPGTHGGGRRPERSLPASPVPWLCAAPRQGRTPGPWLLRLSCCPWGRGQPGEDWGSGVGGTPSPSSASLCLSWTRATSTQVPAAVRCGLWFSPGRLAGLSMPVCDSCPHAAVE